MIEIDPILLGLAALVAWGYWSGCVLRDLVADRRELRAAAARVERRTSEAASR